MGDLIKIVGVQYAVNSNHVKGEDMTAQEQQKTIEFLTMLDRKHPYVSVKPEPTNETDEEAFVARFASRKAGYVRNREDLMFIVSICILTTRKKGILLCCHQNYRHTKILQEYKKRKKYE